MLFFASRIRLVRYLFILGLSFVLPQPAIGDDQFDTGETVELENFTWVVHSSRWSKTAPGLAEVPDASYLIVDLSVTNTSSRPARVPEIELEDDSDNEYTADLAAGLLSGERKVIAEFFDEVNPGVTRRGKLYFDVPQNRTYRLEVEGREGPLSSDADIRLSPQ